MRRSSGLQIWISQLNSRYYALAVGFVIGIIGASIGLTIAVIGPGWPSPL